MFKNNLTSKVLSICAICVFTLFAIASTNDNSSADSSESSSEASGTPAVGVGQVLQTDYFAITVNNVSVDDRINTGNEFADLKPEQDIKYLVINATFKNTDKESRMIMDGSVWINYNGTNYEYDKSETVMLEGWGTMLDQINPLTSKTTNLVYKLPAEVKGAAYWQPGRADKDQRINLGEIK